MASHTGTTCGRPDCVAVSQWNCENITVTVPDDIYRSARIKAAEHGTFVSALVGDYLASSSKQASRFSRLEQQQRRIQRSINRFSGADLLDRDEVHSHAVR
jgi:hypothetical protein